MKALVVINEQHSLFPEQEQLLESEYNEGYELLKAPKNGWTLEDQERIIQDIYSRGNEWDDIVFASPIPYMLKKIATDRGKWESGRVTSYIPEVKVFHNDNRDKKELPNGKVIMVVSQYGWKII